MYNPLKKIHIAVIGASSSGKSFLLYDIIHAFSLLGFNPEELPLSYPHNSFGAFFYDNFNSKTGGMRGTESYFCRPNNHYGAYLSGNYLPMDLPVDFLNIPGEVFNNSKRRIELFFKMKKIIEDNHKGLLYLSEWKSPSGHTAMLIVPKGFNKDYHTPTEMSLADKHGNHMSWGNILYDLNDGRFKEISRREVSGKYIFKHITELNIDSLIQTLTGCWNTLVGEKNSPRWAELDGEQVIHYFYPLAYCDLASDMILCDKLTDHENTTNLENWICHFFDQSKSVNRHFYLAFRAADNIILNKPEWHQQYVSILKDNKTSIQRRNEVYSLFISHLQQAYDRKDQQLEDTFEHIEKSVGDSFWNLLNYAYQKNSWQRHFSRHKDMYELRNANLSFLPPHVYFTATPIDAGFSIYHNDTDVTRFYHNDGNQQKSFTKVVLDDMSQHLCFGSLQLLTDILIQNGLQLFSLCSLRHRSEVLRYSQYHY